LSAPRRSAFLAAQYVAAALLLFYVGRKFASQWQEFRAEPLATSLDWGSILLSCGIVLATYALLVQVWRVLMAGAGSRLRFWRAAEIWSISNLWRYVPGKIWSIGAMSVMAHKAQVPAEAAASASILGVVLNIMTGLALSMLLAWRWLGTYSSGAQGAAIALLLLGILGLLALPYMLPRLSGFAARMLGRDVTLQPPPKWALGLAVAGNMLSWALYGLAFAWLTRGLLGDTAGVTWQYIAVFTASYVIGYIILIAPGGLGPREAAMYELLTSMSLATPKEAALLTVASRVWLTILEIVPGLLFMLSATLRSRRDGSSTNASSH
jgi:glycosyltransferase 2 family protein